MFGLIAGCQKLRRGHCFRVLVVSAWLTACGGDPEPASYFGHVETVTGAVNFEGEPLMPGTVAGSETIDALAAVGNTVFVGTATGVFALAANASSLSSTEVLVLDGSEPAETGAVTQLEPASDGVMVVASAGVFQSHTDALLTYSPLSSLASSAEAPLEVLHQAVDGSWWLASSEGIGHGVPKGGSEVLDVTWLTIAEESEAASALHQIGETLLVAYGARLYEVDLGTLRAHRAPFETGEIHAMAAGLFDTVYLATDRGLFERWPSRCYRQYTLSDGEPVVVRSLSYYAKDGTFALTDQGVLLVRPDESPSGQAALEEVAANGRLTSDAAGTLWIAADRDVKSLPLGTPVGFAADVAPVLGEYCATCHQDGLNNAPPIAYGDYPTALALVGDIVARISSGSMPPAGNPPVPGDALQLIKTWKAGGTPP